jgi:hypothetical protein
MRIASRFVVALVATSLITSFDFVMRAAAAELHVTNAINHNMVFQQEEPIRIWGLTNPRHDVKVTLGDVTTTATADGEGKWYKRLPLPDRAREYRGFLIAGKEGQFFPAQVKVRAVKEGEDIRKECLEVWSEFVPEPTAVRYAWENQPNANAYGLHGLPVAPFRTDNWPFIRAEPNWASDIDQRRKDNEELRKKFEQWKKDRLSRELKRKAEQLGLLESLSG